ncbi:MAG: hypothetical protein K6G23_04320, partial [Lachnospiraceae bacterium]|nr:hypothetical protein [Lachnospiraceae bacterium]
AVTAACLLVRADLYRQVGGMDETMAVAYNDVDLNFKLLEHGYRSVQRNDAVLIHHESLSRGMDEQTKEKWDRLLQEKETLYRKHPLFDGCDPYYDLYLTGNRPDYEINYAFPYERSLETEREEEHAADTVRKAPRTQQIMLTVEHTGLQNKFHASEPEIFHVEGWCYMLQADNCRYRRKLLLQSVQDGQMHLYPVRDRYRYDVDLILPMQQRVSLSGFVCRILQDTLGKGTYKVGMLYEDLINGKTYQNWSDQLLRNE